ncbi:MAG: outer membrane beta-barrel protein [Nibricoccus sp.]
MKKTTISTRLLPVAVLCVLLGSPSTGLAQSAIIPPPAPPPGSNVPSSSEVSHNDSDRYATKDFYLIVQDWSSLSSTKHNVNLPRGDGTRATSDLTFEMKDSVVWGFGFGYSFNENLNLNIDFTFGEPDYTATFAGLRIDGESWTTTGDINLEYNLLKRRFTPYVAAGIGYFYIDTGIPNGPPEYWVWWDYWWGYTATVTQSTFTETYFSANVEAGLRWDIAEGFFAKLGVSSYWVDTHQGWLDNVHANLSIGWKY